MRLRRSDPAGPGISRHRSGRGFAYRAPDGSRLDGDELIRCRRLAVPPAWTGVWICPYPNGHIQAVGTDDAGRKQYLYHDAWHERMAREKFDRMLDLADAIRGARRGVTVDLRSDGVGRRRVLAGAFRMLDVALLRVGSEAYASEHGSIGLTTLLGQHASVRGRRAVQLRFPGKGGQPWESDIDDPDLAALVTALKRRGPGAALLAWRDGTDDASWHALTAEEINEDVRRRTGGDFTAKDFRTMHGTIEAARALAASGTSSSARHRKRAIAAATRAAAAALGNTPAIARSSYIDPRLFDAYEKGRTVDVERRIEGQLRSLLTGS